MSATVLTSAGLDRYEGWRARRDVVAEGRVALSGSEVLSRQPGDVRVAMLGQFRVTARESELAISGGSQRLVAFLALRSCWVKRALIAGTLWPDTSEGRAHASLRSALSRMERT